MKRKRSTPPAPAEGKRLLIDAALRLLMGRSGIHSIGLRELGREAGLNPNTFYWHFADMDALGLAAIEIVFPQLRSGLKEMRDGARDLSEAIRRTVRYVFQFMEQHPEVITFAVREMYGASPKLRRALRGAVDLLVDDIVEATIANRWWPQTDRTRMREVADQIITFMFIRALDYVAEPARRAEMVAHAERSILHVFVGAYVTRTLKMEIDSPLLGQMAGTLATLTRGLGLANGARPSAPAKPRRGRATGP